MRRFSISSSFSQLFRLLLVGGLILWAGTGYALKPENIRHGELDALPPYCPHTMGFDYSFSNKSPRAPYWEAVMGFDLWKVHHYCWALMSLKRAESRTMPLEQRRHIWIDAIGDMDWTVRNSSANFALLPEIHLRMGEVQLLLGSQTGAYNEFLRARQLKPDYWPAYSSWAAVLIKLGLKVEAKKLVAEGLGYAPEAKVLIDQYKALGGDPAKVQPLNKAPAAVDPAASSEATIPAPAQGAAAR